MGKHTPGPWNVYDFGHGGCYIGTSDRPSVTQSICVVGNVREGKANAALIAAAPDMLLALESLECSLNCLRMELADPQAGEVGDLADEAKAAIAKAKGE